ncbi:hypothetical protein [Paenibacillus sp. HW567]|uniref:hypothetical protein n=1 Tax=Paenibacillus sp. HW567 TaxID=1034769 RepID=UPI00037FB7B2|nr:hypothetical protein [Paenibacillus sp. HW567]
MVIGNSKNHEPIKKKGGCLKFILISFSVLLGIFILIGIFAIDDDESVQNQNSSQSGNSINSEKTVDPTPVPFDLDQFKQESQVYPYKELARNPDQYMDQKVLFSGEVVQVIESSKGKGVQYRINVTKGEYGYEDTVLVTYERNDGESRILEEDLVSVWAYSKGLITYESTIGGNITIPKLEAVVIELIP